MFNQLLRASSKKFAQSNLRQFLPTQLTQTRTFHFGEPGFTGEFEVRRFGKDETEEPLEEKRRRLIWQSRKRGISENDLLLTTWFEKNHENMTWEKMDEYDQLINAHVNEWDVFYWISKTRPTPEQFDNETMHALQEHCENKQKEKRLRQPVLKYKNSEE